MRVIKKSNYDEYKVGYDKRRKGIRYIIFNHNNDLDLKTVINWNVRKGEGEYNYVQQFMKPYPGKKRDNVLEDLERELLLHGYYKPSPVISNN